MIWVAFVHSKLQPQCKTDGQHGAFWLTLIIYKDVGRQYSYLHGSNEDVEGHESVGFGDVHHQWSQDEGSNYPQGVDNPHIVVALLAQSVVITVVLRCTLRAGKSLRTEIIIVLRVRAL